MKYLAAACHFVCCDRRQCRRSLPGLLYAPEQDAIILRNGAEWNNRPLYCHQRYTVVLAGEQPGLNGPMGFLYVGVRRGETCVLLQHFAERIARYRPGADGMGNDRSPLAGLESKACWLDACRCQRIRGTA